MGGPLTDIIAASLAAGVATGAACYATFSPTCAMWGPVVARGPKTGPPRVALTFDDGPLPGATDRILDLLAESNVKAAFFVIGSVARKEPRLLLRIHQEGHVIANHSYDHPGLGFLRGQAFWREQIERTDEVIRQTTGLLPRLFRPPLGMKTWMIARAAHSHTVVTWNRRAMDGIATTSQRILDRLLARTRPGDIILLHDGVSPQTHRDPSATVEAVRPLIAGLRSRGVEPVRLDELAGVIPYEC